MQMSPDWSKLAPPLLFSALILFFLYRRVRRSIGRQPLRQRVVGFRFILLIVGAAILLQSPSMTPLAYEAAMAGAVAGAALALVSLRYTKFEITPEGRFYTAHLYIGLAVIALLIGRLAYRLIEAYVVARQTATPLDPNSMPLDVTSPLTFGFVFATIGYYLCYLGGVLWWSRQSSRQVGTAPPNRPA